MSTGYQIKEQHGLHYLPFYMIVICLFLPYRNPRQRGLNNQHFEDYLYSSARNYAGVSNFLKVVVLVLPAKIIR